MSLTLVGFSCSTVLFTSRYSSVSSAAATGRRLHRLPSESRRRPARGDLGGLHVGDGHVHGDRAEHGDHRRAQLLREPGQRHAHARDHRDLDRIGVLERQPHPDHAPSGEVGGDGAERAARQPRDAGVGEHGRGDGVGEGVGPGHARNRYPPLVALG